MGLYHWYDSVTAQLTGGSSSGGGVSQTVVATSTNYTAAAGDLVLANSSAAGVAITLPNPAGVTSPIIVKCVVGPNLVTVLPHAAETIEGSSLLSITASQSYKLVSDNTNWWII